MEKLYNTLNKITEELSRYSIVFGILDENKFKEVSVSILNTDNTTTKINMSIQDIMYFTEHGTLTIPARPILNKLFNWVNSHVDSVVDNIVDRSFKENDIEKIVFEELTFFKNNITVAISDIINITINNDSTLSKLLEVDDENKYLFNLNELKKYISCKIIIRN